MTNLKEAELREEIRLLRSGMKVILEFCGEDEEDAELQMTCIARTARNRIDHTGQVG